MKNAVEAKANRRHADVHQGAGRLAPPIILGRVGDRPPRIERDRNGDPIRVLPGRDRRVHQGWVRWLAYCQQHGLTQNGTRLDGCPPPSVLRKRGLAKQVPFLDYRAAA